MKRKNAFIGAWRITWMEEWDSEARDLLGPAFITFHGVDTGEFRFCAVEGSMDTRYGDQGGKPLVEFSWEGSDEMDEVSGRGWAVIEEDGTLRGHLYFHYGDDSAFKAVRDVKEPRKQRGRRK